MAYLPDPARQRRPRSETDHRLRSCSGGTPPPRHLAENRSTGSDHRSITVDLEDCGLLECEFDAGSLRWKSERPTPWGLEGVDAYEAVGVRSGRLVVTIDRLQDRASLLALIDLPANRVTIVLTELVGSDQGIREQTRVFVGGLNGKAPEPFERTTDLAGLRLHHRYSTTHAFEHIYVDENHYVWHGLEGPEAGIGGYEPAEAYKIADDLYLFTWHECMSPFNGTIVIDLEKGRSVGRLFGWHMTEHRAISVQTGSTTTVLNRTSYEGL